MFRNSRLMNIALLALFLAMLWFPASALANKQRWKAQMSGANEVPAVASNVSGSLIIATRYGGASHAVFGHLTGLSEQPVGIHLHGPADTTMNAPVILTLCGGPPPAMLSSCPAPDANGNITLAGDITSSLAAQWGLRTAQFHSWLNGEQIYVNVHTSAFPMGISRGQLVPH